MGGVGQRRTGEGRQADSSTSAPASVTGAREEKVVSFITRVSLSSKQKVRKA